MLNKQDIIWDDEVGSDIAVATLPTEAINPDDIQWDEDISNVPPQEEVRAEALPPPPPTEEIIKPSMPQEELQGTSAIGITHPEQARAGEILRSDKALKQRLDEISTAMEAQPEFYKGQTPETVLQRQIEAEKAGATGEVQTPFIDPPEWAAFILGGGIPGIIKTGMTAGLRMAASKAISRGLEATAMGLVQYPIGQATESLAQTEFGKAHPEVPIAFNFIANGAAIYGLNRAINNLQMTDTWRKMSINDRDLVTQTVEQMRQAQPYGKFKGFSEGQIARMSPAAYEEAFAKRMPTEVPVTPPEPIIPPEAVASQFKGPLATMYETRLAQYTAQGMPTEAAVLKAFGEVSNTIDGQIQTKKIVEAQKVEADTIRQQEEIKATEQAMKEVEAATPKEEDIIWEEPTKEILKPEEYALTPIEEESDIISKMTPKQGAGKPTGKIPEVPEGGNREITRNDLTEINDLPPDRVAPIVEWDSIAANRVYGKRKYEIEKYILNPLWKAFQGRNHIVDSKGRVVPLTDKPFLSNVLVDETSGRMFIQIRTPLTDPNSPDAMGHGSEPRYFEINKKLLDNIKPIKEIILKIPDNITEVLEDRISILVRKNRLSEEQLTEKEKNEKYILDKILDANDYGEGKGGIPLKEDVIENYPDLKKYIVKEILPNEPIRSPKEGEQPIPSKEITEELPLEQATKEAAERKFVKEKQLPLGEKTVLDSLIKEAQKYESYEKFKDVFLMKRLWNLLPINTIEHQLAKDIQDIEAGKLKVSPIVMFEKHLRKSGTFNSLKELYELSKKQVEIPEWKVKEPWEMTREEFVKEYSYKNAVTLEGKPKKITEGMIESFKDNHEITVQRAISEGKPVPPEVLKDYPELEKEGKVKPVWIKGQSAKIIKKYGDVPVGKIGQIVKSWIVKKGLSKGKQYITLDFGKNLTGQRLRQSYPTESLQIVEIPSTVEAKLGEEVGFKPSEGFKRRTVEPTEAETGKPTKRSDIVKFLQEKLDIPIRTGRFRQRALGIFKVKEEVVRSRLSNDIETIAHEIGHGLHKYLWGRTAQGLSAKPLKDFKDELEPIASKPRAGQSPLPEGFAEFIRLYITDETQARKVAPKFYDYFEKLLNEKSPEAKEIFLDARKQFERWIKQPSLARVLGQISIGEKIRRPVNFTEIYTATIDEMHPLKKAVDEMAKGEVLEPGQDPYKLARLFKGWWGKPDAFLTHKPFKYGTYEWTGKSLKEILDPIADNLDEFRAYIISKRTLELKKRGMETGVLAEDARKIVEQYGIKYAQKFEELKTYQDNVLQYLKDSGILDDSTYAKIKELNKDYVPLYRIMETEKGMGTGRGLQAYQPIKKIKGSWRDIVDPIESVVKNTYLYINLAEKNAVGKALVELAKSKEGLGKYVEKIPEAMQRIKIKEPELLGILSKYGKWTETTQYKEMKTTVGEKITEVGAVEGEKKTAAEKVEKVAKEALTSRGYSEAEAQQILDRIKKAPTAEAKSKIIEKTIEKLTVIQTTKEFGLDLPENVAEIFRPSAFQPKDNVIAVWRNGRRELYQVHPDIARTIQALDKESISTILKILSIPTRWLRAGATLSPEFIARNPIRDQFSAFVYSKYGFIPGFDLTRGIYHLVMKDDIYWKWKQSGGEHSMFVSLDRKYLQKNLQDVMKGITVKNIVKSPIEMLRVLSEAMEAGTRIGEFAKGIKKEGITKAGLQKSAFAAREVTLDFARIGAKTKAVNSLIAFWNANVQGLDKMARAFKENPFTTTIKALAALTLPSVILTIVNRKDERWKEIPQWQKDIFWIVMTKDNIWRIPKPFELGIIFGTVPERITEAILDNDPKAFDGLLKTIGTGAAPGLLPTVMTPLVEAWANRSFFLDRPIVPRGKEELLPQYQYQPYTTETAKIVGKAISKIPGVGETFMASPAKMENLLRGWTGNLGYLALQTADMALRKAGAMPDKTIKPTRVLSDIPLIRGFSVRYPSSDAESVRKFFDNYTKANQILMTARSLVKKGEMEEAQEVALSGDITRLQDHYKALRNASKVIDSIYMNPKINPDEKRDMIDKVYFSMIQIARNGNEILDNINSHAKPERK